MITQIIFAFPLMLLVAAGLYITGLSLNRWLKLLESPAGNTWLNLSGHVVLGFIVLATIYAMVVTRGKSILSGILFLTVLYKILFRNQETKPISVWSKLSELVSVRTILFIFGILFGAYLYIIAQHFPALKTGYPISYVDYHYYAMYSKGLGFTGVENRDNIYSSFTGIKGTFLYHYLDFWMTDFLARLTGFNHFIVLVFVIYPLLLATLVMGLCGIVAVPLSPGKTWRICLLAAALAGTSLYFSLYESIPLLNDFWLICFVGKFMSYKLFIIYAILVCGVSQLTAGNKPLATFWVLQLCFIYTTTMPGICAGITGILVVASVRGYFNHNVLIKVFAMVLFAAGYCLIFDRLFSDNPRNIMETHSLMSFKEFAIFYLDFVVRLVIVFLPAIALLLLRMWKKIDFDASEKTGWLFVTGAILCLIPFIAFNRSEPDNEQSLFNIVPPVAIVLSAVGLYKIFDSRLSLKWRVTTLTVITLFAVYNVYTDFCETSYYLKWHNVYSIDYIQACLRDINACKGNTVNIVFVNKEDRDRIERWYYDYHLKDAFICYSQKTTASIDISPYLQLQRTNSDYFGNPANIYNPVEIWLRKNYPGSSVFNEQILLDFLKTYHVKYMFINSAYSLTPLVAGHLAPVSKDPKTGESFFRTDFN